MEILWIYMLHNNVIYYLVIKIQDKNKFIKFKDQRKQIQNYVFFGGVV